MIGRVYALLPCLGTSIYLLYSSCWATSLVVADSPSISESTSYSVQPVSFLLAHLSCTTYQPTQAYLHTQTTRLATAAAKAPVRAVPSA
jgi:hypothetical protein